MKVLLADEYGFCFGVERAVEMVEEAEPDGLNANGDRDFLLRHQPGEAFATWAHRAGEEDLT